jgi:hypothetical protein
MGDFNREVLNGLPDVFAMEELRASISRAAKQLPEREQETTKGLLNNNLYKTRCLRYVLRSEELRKTNQRVALSSGASLVAGNEYLE